MELVVFVLLGVVCAAVALAAWRFLTVRSHGAPALMRRYPAHDTHEWRHGVIRYRGDIMEFYKLRSLWPTADLRLDRTHTTAEGHRRAGDEDPDILDSDYIVLHIESAGKGYEFAVSHHAAKAVVAWTESAPSERKERLDHRSLLMKASRKRKR